jgi:hypothetical protein
MIDFGRIILIGRHEKITDEKRYILSAITPMLEKAAQALKERWPDRLDAWERWNVAAWHVDGPILQRVDLLRFEGLGVAPLPHLTERWVYVAKFHHIDPLEVPDDPPLLHRSSQLLDADNLPQKGTSRLRPSELRRTPERILDLERALEHEGILDAPQAQTARGFENLLRWKGLRIVPKGDGWRLEQVPDDQRWTTATGGDRLHQILPQRLDQAGPQGLSFGVVEA